MKTVSNLRDGINKNILIKNAHIPSIVSEIISNNYEEFYLNIPEDIRISSYKELGSGSYGTAYSCTIDGHIIKITKDPSESYFYNRISLLGILPHCICNGVILKEIKDSNQNFISIILREYAFPIDNKEESNLRRFFREYNHCIEALFPANVISYEETPSAHKLSFNISKRGEASGKYKKGIIWAAELLKNCRDILRTSSLSTEDRRLRKFGLEILQLAEGGIYFPDLKPRNIGKKEDSSYCVFDVGRSFFAI